MSDENTVCHWVEQYDGSWLPQCFGVPHVLAEADETPKSVGFNYCPFCGKELDEVEHDPEFD
jgi:hypothetical protein